MKKIFVSNTLDPYRNVAAERRLMREAGDVCLFLWVNGPCVIAGYNQDAISQWDSGALGLYGVLPVRRFTGGGTVYHDEGNLNFSFAYPDGILEREECLEIVKTALAKAGIEAEVSGRNDILAGGRKVSGCAWMSEEGKTLVHGTLMVDVDRDMMSRLLTPENEKYSGRGIRSVSSRVANLVEMTEGLTVGRMKELVMDSFREAYPDAVFCGEAPPDEECARRISSPAYIYRTIAPLDTTVTRRLERGTVTLHLTLDGDRITKARVFTDSTDLDFPERIRRRLEGNSFLELDGLLEGV